MAERVGFEPTDALRHRLISSQVHSTTLPPLREARIIPAKRPSVTALTEGKALPKLLRLICCFALAGLAACSRIDPPETDGRLVVAIREAPAFFQREGNTASGFEHDLVTAFADSLGLKVNFIKAADAL
jgi:hypothetical protein